MNRVDAPAQCLRQLAAAAHHQVKFSRISPMPRAQRMLDCVRVVGRQGGSHLPACAIAREDAIFGQDFAQAAQQPQMTRGDTQRLRQRVRRKTVTDLGFPAQLAQRRGNIGHAQAIKQRGHIQGVGGELILVLQLLQPPRHIFSHGGQCGPGACRVRRT